jgi:hypothetical protein
MIKKIVILSTVQAPTTVLNRIHHLKVNKYVFIKNLETSASVFLLR